MRTLIVAGSPSVDPRRVSVLASACDLIIAADSGAVACLEADVVPDVLVGDMDSVDAVTLGTVERKGADIVRFPVRKDRTDLDLAVSVARERGCTRLVLTGVIGGRTDHGLAAFGAFGRAHDLQPILDETGSRGWLLSRAGRRSLTLVGQGTTVSVFALGRRARVGSAGLEWPLDGIRLEPLSPHGVSNRITSETATIQWHSGLVLVLSPQVGDVSPAREIPGT